MATESGEGSAAVPAAPRACLAIRSGAWERTVAVPVSPFTIGRQPDNLLVLSNEHVSGYHARLLFLGQWYVGDAGSLNGVFVNGRRILLERLNPGDEIGIGPIVLRFDAAAAVRAVIDSVEFTLTAPSTLAPGGVCVLGVWAHLPVQRHEIIERAREAHTEGGIQIYSKAGVAVARGSVLTARLKLPGVNVVDQEDTVLWDGNVGNVGFPVKVPEDARFGSYPGTVTVHADGLQIAKIHFVLEVGAVEHPLAQLATQERRHHTAFASYATVDRDEVLGRIQGMQKALPGLDVFLDVASIRSGENWQERLMAEIRRRDVFYLFWSLAASHSEWVGREWRTALNTRGIDYIDPVPLASPDEVPPPGELADRLHFNDWTLAYKRHRQRDTVV